MGEIAELVMEGVLCQECTCPVDDSHPQLAACGPQGHPRYCYDCGGDIECNGAAKRKGKKKGKRKSEKTRGRRGNTQRSP